MTPPLLAQEIGSAEAFVKTDITKLDLPARIRQRDDLRRVIRARGANPLTIESITGDCNEQTGTQIQDYENWLSKN